MVETPSPTSGVGAVAQTPGQRTTPASRDLAALALTCTSDQESRLPPGRTLNTARAAALLQMAISPNGTTWPASVPAQRGIVADGQLTREEFGIIYYDDAGALDEEQWSAYIGGDQNGFQRGTGAAEGELVVKDLRDLEAYGRQFNEFAEAIGQNPAQFMERLRQSDHITIVNPRQLELFLLNLRDDQIATLVRSYRDLVKTVLQRNDRGSYEPSLSPDELDAQLAQDLRALVNEARQPGAGGAEARRILGLIGMGIMHHLNDTAEQNIDNDGLSELGLSDPVVARRFLADVFSSAISGPGNDITDVQFEAVRTFSGQVARLRTIIGADAQLTAKLNSADQSSAQFTRLLEMLGDGSTEQQIRDQIRTLPSQPAPPAHVPNMGAMPILPGAVTRGDQVPTAPVTTPAETPAVPGPVTLGPTEVAISPQYDPRGASADYQLSMPSPDYGYRPSIGLDTGELRSPVSTLGQRPLY